MIIGLFELKKMKPKKRKMQITQRQGRRAKNLSFKQISLKEKKMVTEQEKKARQANWKTIKESMDADSLLDVEGWHNIKFKPVLQSLVKRFPEKLEILDEGAGRSSLKHELLKSELGEKLNVTTIDVRRGATWSDKIVNIMGLVDKFGKNKFHLVVSTVGGATYSPLHEKAFFQIVSVLKPGGTGIVSTQLSNKRLRELAKRFNLSIKQFYGGNVVFSKNLVRRKR